MKLPDNTVNKILLESSKSFNGDYFYYRSDRIPADKLSNAREIHEIGINEEILLLIDTGVLIHNGKNSVLFFETGISISCGDSWDGFSHWFINWKDIQEVKIIDDKFVFYFDNSNLENNFTILIGGIIPIDGINTNQFIIIVKRIINEYSKYKNEISLKLDDIIKECTECIEKKDYIKALDFANQANEIYPDCYASYLLKPTVLNEMGRYDESLPYLDLAVNDFKYLENGDQDSRIMLGSIYDLKAKTLINMKKYYEAALNMNMAEYFSPPNGTDIIEEKYEYYNKYIENFYDIEYNDRKIILFTEEYPLVKPDNFIIVLKNNYSSIKFPVGHPQKNELYFGHPLKNNIYYHYKNFENILFQEKLMELNDILECLGAKTIKTKTMGNIALKNVSNSSTDVKVNASYIVGAKGELSSEYNDRNETQSNNKISSEQSFSYNKEPYLPDNLLWFHHEPTWQKLSEQRFKGNIIKSNIKISSKELEYVTSSEKNKALAEVKSIILRIKASAESESTYESRKETDVEWEIEVEFYPIKKNIENYEVTNAETNLLKKDIINDLEEDYIDLFKECFEDGKISEDERKILERYKKKYNISDQRSKELENKILETNQLNANEIEYYEEVQFCLQEDNLISLDERRILDRLRKKLNIDEKRAIEIENNLLKK